ncbi:CHAD domain-containing protein [Pseudomonas knackmussii]|uniref:CHAD domain-containing protein n=1 Tax=Pseudomonas knackmussii TaxID=65741 RepID=UPI003F49B9C4
MSFADAVVISIVSLEVEVVHAFARLREESDNEALHDLRICVRRLRSLLKPLALGEVAAGLEAISAELGRLTTPIRDLEVMAEELQQRGFAQAAQRRRDAVSVWYRASADHVAVERLVAALDDWPRTFRESIADSASGNLRRRTAQRLRRQFERLDAALNDPDHDRHSIRLLVKRARYAQEAYPQLLPLPFDLAARLKRLQSSLGSWHDHHQWCLKAVSEDDLKPLVCAWREAEQSALVAAEQDITDLAGELTLFLRLLDVEAEPASGAFLAPA